MSPVVIAGVGSTFWSAYHSTMRSLDHLNSRQWLIVLVLVVVWGVFCMRGFASHGRI
jgi:hypothetical protein